MSHTRNGEKGGAVSEVIDDSPYRVDKMPPRRPPALVQMPGLWPARCKALRAGLRLSAMPGIGLREPAGDSPKTRRAPSADDQDEARREQRPFGPVSAKAARHALANLSAAARPGACRPG